MLKLNIQLFAATYDVVLRIYNGTDWDTLRPQTVSDNVDDSASTTKKFSTSQEKTNYNSLFVSNAFIGLWKANPVFTGVLKSENSKMIMDEKGVAFDTGGTAGYKYFGILENSSQGEGEIGFRSLDGTVKNSIARFESSIITLTNGVTIRYGTTTIGNAKDLVTKEYVDTTALNIRPTTAVKAVSTTNIIIANTITALDGYTLADTNRVLLKDQTTATENGIYTWSSSTQKLTKVSSAGNENVNGSLVFVEMGNTQKNDRFFCVNFSTGLWILFDSNIEMIAGSGISISGTTISVATGGVTNAMLAGSIAVSKLLLDAPTDGGLQISTNSMIIKALGVTNAMLAGSIDIAKLASFTTLDNQNAAYDTWDELLPVGTSQSLQVKLNTLFAAIGKLRGTFNYNTSNTQTIVGAYSAIDNIIAGNGQATGKNKMTRGTTLPVSNMVSGDLHFLHS